MSRILKYSIILLSALIFSVVFIDRLPQLITIILFSAGAIYFIIQKVDKDMRNKIIVLFLVAFLLQICLSLFLYNQTVETKYYGFSYKGDDYVYGDFGIIVGDLWRRGIFQKIERLSYYNLIGERAEVQIYQLYTAVVFYLFNKYGAQMLLIINCFFHAAIIIPVYFICKNLHIRNNIIIFIFFLFLFWPSTFYWSLFNFKEPMLLVSLFTILSLFPRERKTEGIFNLNFIYLAFPFFIIYLLKPYLFFILMVMLLTYSIFMHRWSSAEKALVLALLLFLIFAQLAVSPLFSNLFLQLLDFPNISYGIRNAVTASNTSYFTGLISTTYARMLLYFPFGVSATMFLPFLARPFSPSHVIANIESILWWFFIPFLINGIGLSIRTEFKKTFSIIFIFFVWLSLLALVQGNMGTLLRQKSIIYYTGFIFIGLAIDRILYKGQGARV